MTTYVVTIITDVYLIRFLRTTAFWKNRNEFRIDGLLPKMSAKCVKDMN